MNGSGYFFAFATVAFPAAAVALLALRRKIHFWLWLERQWEARAAMVEARKRRKPQQEILLFPELAAPAPAVNDWSTTAPRKAVRS